MRKERDYTVEVSPGVLIRICLCVVGFSYGRSRGEMLGYTNLQWGIVLTRGSIPISLQIDQVCLGVCSFTCVCVCVFLFINRIFSVRLHFNES